MPKVEAKKAASPSTRCFLSGMGVNVYAAQLAREGKMKGMFFYNSNMVAGYSNPAYLQECLANLELSVCIDVQMTETCHACDYVLPDTSYLERLELPRVLRRQDPGRGHPRPGHRRCIPTPGPSTRSSPSWPRLAAWASTSASPSRSSPTRSLRPWACPSTACAPAACSPSPKAFRYGSYPKWKGTPSGKFQFASDACEGGPAPCPQWLRARSGRAEDSKSFPLIGGKAGHPHPTQTRQQ